MSELVNPIVSPVYLLRSYIWEVLKANDADTWDESSYGGMVPIVPLAEEPELQEFTGPHIVYGYAVSGTNTLFAIESGSMTLVIYDDNFRRLTKTMNTLQVALGRLDETARDVNRYTSSVGSENPLEAAHPFGGIRFTYIGLGFSEGGSPESTEGGRQSGLLNIRFDFLSDYDVVTDVVT